MGILTLTSGKNAKYLPIQQFNQLLSNIADMGYELLGPVIQDQAVVYDTIDSSDDLPVGWLDKQEGGYYRLEKAPVDSYFGYVVGPDSWKKYLFPKEETLFKVERDEDGKLNFQSTRPKPGKKAFIGIRSCELHSIAIQDRVFVSDQFTDPAYAERRENLLFVAVNCSRSAATCFCSSVDAGPAANSGFDLALTEVIDQQQHYFVIEIGSEQGAQAIDSLNLEQADDVQIDAAKAAVANAAKQQRSLDTKGLKERLYQNQENEEFWSDVADRCLNCANCTQVCPTCFCNNVEERTALDGSGAERVRFWDSCFNLEHSHIAGGSVRQSGMSRYRQWLTHKLGSWQDQFDTLGCVGCGRCISWCPVGIDITAEAKRLQQVAEE